MSAQNESAAVPSASAEKPECFLLSISDAHVDGAAMVPHELGGWVRYADWKKAAERSDDPEAWSDDQMRAFLATALRHVEVMGELRFQDIRDAFRMMREQGQSSRDV